MLLAAKALIIVAFALEELLEVRLAVEITRKGSKCAQAEFGVAVFAAETGRVEYQVVSHQSLHGVDGLLT